MKTQAIVLIPTYNRASILKIALKHLNNSSKKELFDVCVVDNGSTDGTREVVKSHKGVLYLKERKNRFIAKALNNAFFQKKLHTKYKYIIIMANDVLVNKMTIKCLIEFMHNHPSIAVSGPSHYDWFTNELLNTGLTINPTTSLLSNKVSEPIGIGINHFHSCFIVRSDAFKKVRGFNATLFPMIFEEPDLGNRILKLGYRIAPCRSAKIWHPIELNKIKVRIPDLQVPKMRLYDSIPKAYLFFRNRIIYMSLHSRLIDFVIFYTLLNPVIFLYYLGSIRKDYFFYVFRGLLDGTVFAFTKNVNFIAKQNRKILHI